MDDLQENEREGGVIFEVDNSSGGYLSRVWHLSPSLNTISRCDTSKGLQVH
jgi:hypothetical protein